ncbi:DUF4183 domain-containing protein [Bacillus thuringiensis]|uniref:DUF4183 domain-containing protein n=1 Tax=Bacillus cereus group TaxID=86661 RepID=UPI002961D45A|nr:DUF4183 domain-containing protein [Bacillus cereus]HEF1869711.1 DUF4183 domain-containing protein [Bacillus cereus]HEF1880342.1 DUF4183 domain-containing protein [Bacillus cereus]HEF1886464.1 DUF4183 domain-containing protein [Bacillus cereus]
MALQLMKIAATGSTVTTTDPDDSRFFYVTTAPTTAGNTLTIDAASFFQDDGTAVTTLPTLATNNSYFNVYVNGVLQMEGISTYTPGTTGVGFLAIAVPVGADTVLTDTPVVLEIVQFTPTSTTTVAT